MDQNGVSRRQYLEAASDNLSPKQIVTNIFAFKKTPRHLWTLSKLEIFGAENIKKITELELKWRFLNFSGRWKKNTLERLDVTVSFRG